MRDPQGRPLPDRQVTLEASTGTLEAAYGFAVQRARAVTVRTGADGSARLTLRAHTIEPLTADQQAALENALGQLDAGADSPNLLRTSFLSVAATYQDERQHALRAAFDIYARQWKAQFFDQINPSSLGFQWPTGGVRRARRLPSPGRRRGGADHRGAGGELEELGGRMVRVSRRLPHRAGEAAERVRRRRRSAAPRATVWWTTLLGEAHSFVADQKGLAAEWLSQRVVKYAVNDFLGRELEGVDDDTQRELFSNLEGAATQLTRQSRGAIAMVNQTRVDLDDKITKVGGINAGVLDEIRGLHAEVLARASQVDTQFTAINATKADLDGRLTQFDSRFGTFSTQFADFGQRYNTFTSNVSTFNQNFTKFNTDYSDFRTRYDDIGGRLTVFDQNVAGFNQNLSGFNQNLSKFNTDYADFRTRSDTIGGRLNTFDQNFASFNQSLTGFNQNLTGFNQSLVGFDQNLAGFNQNLGRFNTDLGAFQTQRTQMTQELNTVKADLSTVKTDFSGVKRDLATTRADVTAVRTEVGTIRTDVGAVRNELGTVRADVTAVRTASARSDRCRHGQNRAGNDAYGRGFGQDRSDRHQNRCQQAQPAHTPGAGQTPSSGQTPGPEQAPSGGKPRAPRKPKPTG